MGYISGRRRKRARRDLVGWLLDTRARRDPSAVPPSVLQPFFPSTRRSALAVVASPTRRRKLMREADGADAKGLLADLTARADAAWARLRRVKGRGALRRWRATTARLTAHR